MKASVVIARLKAAGWVLARTKGSHQTFKHEGNPLLVTVSDHGGDMTIGQLRSIERITGLRLR